MRRGWDKIAQPPQALAAACDRHIFPTAARRAARLRAPEQRGTAMAAQTAFDRLKGFGAKLVDWVYDASVYSVVAYSAMLVAFAVVGAAIALRVVDAPQFHPPA
jgi:hypothetical protein